MSTIRSRRTKRTLTAGVASVALLVGLTASAWAQTASPPPPLSPVVQCGSDLVVSSTERPCTSPSAQWVIPSVSGQQFVMPTGLPRAGGGPADGHDAR